MKKLLPHLFTVLLLGSVATLALLIDGTTIAPAEASLPDRAESELLAAALPDYPGAQAIPVGRQMIVNGQRMNLDVAYVDGADLPSIAEHYVAALRDAGLHPTISTNASSEGPLGYRISALASDGRQYAVDIEPMRGGAVILPTVTRGILQVGAGAAELGLPVPEQHAALLHSSARDGNQSSKNVQFVAALELEGLFDFYREALQSEGWSTAGEPLQDERIAEVRMQNFQRADHRLRISARDMEEGGTMVYLLEEWKEASP